MEEGVVVRWLKAEGDSVSKGEPILEIETDKATLEVECGSTGVVRKILVAEGQTVPVHTPLAWVGSATEPLEPVVDATPPPSGTKPIETAPPAALQRTAVSPSAQTPAGRLKASPAARRIGRERSVDLTTIGTGRGPEGRIVVADVMAASMREPSCLPEPSVTASLGVSEATPTSQVALSPLAFEPGMVRRPMSRMRRAIARTLTLSKQTIPHFYVRGTIDAQALDDFRQREKRKYPCTINDVVVLACARAMRELPVFCCRMDGDDVVQYPDVNIGVAVGTEEGLIVPVVAAVQNMTLMKVAQETRRIAEAARAGRLERSAPGTMTVTNLGMFGIEEFEAIINPPEVAILAVGALRDGIVVKDRGVFPTRVMALNLSVDHRVIDGITAAKFLHRVKELLEKPSELPC